MTILQLCARSPRQVGKTTLSKNLNLHFEYLNFDDSEERKIILNRSWKRDIDLIAISK